jgi:hypothetical protein
VGVPGYRNNLLLAKDGTQHLLQARELLTGLLQHPLDAHGVAQVHQEFSIALNNFSIIDNNLSFVPGAAAFLPVYGDDVHAALHLVPLAMELARAGVTSCDILSLLIARLQNPLSGQTQGMTMADLTFITQSLHDIQTSLRSVAAENNQLGTADMQFDPRINQLVTTLHKNLPMVQSWLDSIEKLVPIAPLLLGVDTPANYLIEVLDSTELRPGGGFIGNYGIVTFSGGQLTNAHITDTDLLDHPFIDAGLGTPFPVDYRWFDIALGNWGLRDSNLDADFPTAARDAELTYTHEGGNVPLQGVIAITPAFIQQALEITGPIYLPEYHETINARNLIERIHYHQLGHGIEGPDTIASPDGYSSLRKRFTALLAEHFFARIRQSASSNVARLMMMMINGIRLKDLQLYFNNADAEALLHNNQLDAAIQSEPGDDIFIVDANISANKANNFIQSTLADTVTIDAAGNAIHHATLRYAWTIPGLYYGPPLYRDYVRVYVPKGSILQSQNGWEQQGNGTAFGHEVLAGFFTLNYGQTRTISLIWRVPHAANYDQQGWHYRDMIQRQAGTNWSLHVHTFLPACATLKSRAMKPGSKQAAMLNQLLTENIHIALDYTC